MLSYHPMSEADLDWVSEAEARSHAYPWTRGNFVDSLAAGYEALLACDGDQWVGYTVTMPVVDEVHLLDITVLPERQRQGCGTQMLTHLLRLAKDRGVTRMLLEVRQSNVPAQALYERQGFVNIGQRRAYYPVTTAPGSPDNEISTLPVAQREDAIVMARDL